MMFVFGDMHGRWDFLEKLLQAAGIVDEDGDLAMDDIVVGVGDLINGTFMDTNNDTEIIERAKDYVDYWVVGNHDAVYSHPHLSFQGFTPSPVLQTEYNTWMRSGKLVPAVCVANTLITHAGVNAAFNFQTAGEAFDAITDVWEHYYEIANPVPGGSTPLGGEPWQFKGRRYDRATLVDGIGFDRGGRAAVAGILWDDWSQPKNTNFSQVVGHTPIKSGPVLHRHLGSNEFTLNIDVGAKKGLTPYGVWINEVGEIESFVTVEVDDETSDTSS